MRQAPAIEVSELGNVMPGLVTPAARQAAIVQQRVAEPAASAAAADVAELGGRAATLRATTPSSRRRHFERLAEAAASVATPALLLNIDVVDDNVRRMTSAFPGAAIYYAVKANPHPSLVSALIAHGCGMDVASGPELRLALDLGAQAGRICFSAPFKRGADIADAHRAEVELYVADTPDEIAAIARHAPGRRLLIRVAVGDGQCANPMGDKFGADPSEVADLLGAARAQGLVPWGLHFHVGSQCVDAGKWADAVRVCAPIWRAAAAAGHDLRVLDIGGGYPVRYGDGVPAIETIGRTVITAIRTHIGPDAEVTVEPGRWVVRNAAVLATEVLGTACRRGVHWAYLDVGVYNGLIDALDGVRWPMTTLDEVVTGRRLAPRPVTLAGPTCDGGDVIVRNASLPPLRPGDRVLFFQTGAYTTSFAQFNGIRFPTTVDLRQQRRSGAA